MDDQTRAAIEAQRVFHEQEALRHEDHAAELGEILADPPIEPPIEPPVDPPPTNGLLLVSGPNVEDLTVGARFDIPRDANNEPKTSTAWWHPNGEEFDGGSVRGNAPVTINGGGALNVRIAADDWQDPHGRATGSHEAFMPQTTTHRRVNAGMDVRFTDTPTTPWDPGLTGKFFGLANFSQALDPDWSHFPGGGRTDNVHGFFSVRVMQHWWVPPGQEAASRQLVTGPPGSSVDRFRNTRWRLGLYVYTSAADAAGIGGVDVMNGDRINPYVSNAAHSAEFLCHGYGAPLVETWQQLRLEVDAGSSGRPDGSAALWVGDQQLIQLLDIQWNRSGPRSFNFPYVSMYIGGNDRRFAPYTPDRAAELQYRGMTVMGVA